MKNKIFTILVFVGALGFSQVAIDPGSTGSTYSPQSTLDINGNASSSNELLRGGLRLNWPGNDKTASTINNNTTNPLEVLASITDMQNQNFLVQDGASKKVNYAKRWFSTFQPIRPSEYSIYVGDQVVAYDHTILVHNNIVLPNNAALSSKIVTLVYSHSSQAPFTITGYAANKIQFNGQLINSVTIDPEHPSYTFQFDGNEWIIIDGFVNPAQPVAPIGNVQAFTTTSAATYTMIPADNIIHVAGSTSTLVFPLASANSGRIYTIANTKDTSVSFDFAGGGGMKYSTGNYAGSLDSGDRVTVQSNGSEWIIIGK